MSTIMITGGSGFLGTYVARMLAERGDRVIIFDAVGPAAELATLTAPYERQIVLVRGQILDLSSLLRCVQQHKVERIFHAAALYDPPYSLEEPALTFQVNVNGTIHVLEAARLQVYKGSCRVAALLSMRPASMNQLTSGIPYLCLQQAIRWDRTEPQRPQQRL